MVSLHLRISEKTEKELTMTNPCATGFLQVFVLLPSPFHVLPGFTCTSTTLTDFLWPMQGMRLFRAIGAADRASLNPAVSSG